MAVADTIDAEVRSLRSSLEREALAGLRRGLRAARERGAQMVASTVAGVAAAGSRVVAEAEAELARAGLPTAQVATARAAIEGVIATLRAQAGDVLSATLDRIASAPRTAEAELVALAGALGTLADTAVAGLERGVTVAQSADAGIEWWLYDGPDDERTRPDCRAWVGRRFTLAQIQALTSEAGPQPVWQYGGGWNCRHRWTPLDPVLVEDFPAWTP